LDELRSDQGFIASPHHTDLPTQMPEIPSHILFRSATNDDRERIEKLVFGVLAEYELKPDPAATDSDLQDIEGMYLRRGGMFEIVEDADGALLGTVGLYPVNEETCELRKMYFVPEARGKGLGRYVLERAVESARRLGFRRITLETASVLEEAIRLYTRFGFRPFAQSHLSARCDQAYYYDLLP
jgi:putative acetyltransferase